jgi:hypothetical protein
VRYSWGVTIYKRYRHLAIEWSKGPPDPVEVEALEEKLGRELPSDFREFIEVANGGSCDYLVSVPVKPGGEEMFFPGIYSIGRNRQGEYGEGNMLWELEAERQVKNLPRGVLPFAHSGDDGVVFLDLTATGAGRVVAFVPGWAGGVEGVAKSSFVVVAPSFSEFVGMLHVDVAEAERAAREAFASGNPEQIQGVREYLDIGLPDWRERFGLMDVD